MDETNIMKKRLPDFIFSRRRDIELEGKFSLAGMLLTDFPKDYRFRSRDRELIQQIITELTRLVEHAPELNEAGIWRTNIKPLDGLAPPFDERLVEDRSGCCICIMITAGSSSVMSVPSDLVREVSGGVVL